MGMGCFLSIGECMVEMTPASDGHYVMGFAGDTFNTAWYARRALRPEATVAYLTAVGTDETSRRMLAFMRDCGIEPEAEEFPDCTVGLYLVTLTNGERSFSYWRDSSAARRLARRLERLPRVQGPGDVAYFSGITLAVLPPDDRETLLACLGAARGAGVTIAFDPNLRPRLWRSDDEMRHWVMKGAAEADIALPSFEDEAAQFGDASVADTARRYKDAGAATVIVKNGADAVHASGPDGATFEVSPIAVRPADTTAAGDSFNAAALAALMSGEPLRETVEKGCRLAAHVVSRRGALVP